MWPLQLRTESAHEEGGIREWSVATTSFEGDADGNVRKVHAVRVGPPPEFKPISGSDFTLDADLVLIAMGFVGPKKSGLLDELGVALDSRGNVSTDENYMTSIPDVFTAGDMRRGQSLVVWAIAEGRKAAKYIDLHLMGFSNLP
jgi:glutamate synthase (NADPH/NADH) small chain